MHDNIRLFVINLDKDVKRWEHMQEQLNKTPSLLPYERFPAVDGRALSEEEIEQVTTERGARYCTRSMIGCAASHMSVWRHALALDVDYAVIFEDDALLLDGWQDAMLEILADKESFDVLFLDVQDQSESFGMLQMQTFFDNLLRGDHSPPDIIRRRIHTTSSRVTPIRSVCGLHAYVVSREGLRVLLEQFDDGISWHLDGSLSTRNLAMLRANPPLCSYTTAFDSNLCGRSLFLWPFPDSLRCGRQKVSWLLANVVVKTGDFEVLVIHFILILALFLLLIAMAVRRFLLTRQNHRARDPDA